MSGSRQHSPDRQRREAERRLLQMMPGMIADDAPDRAGLLTALREIMSADRVVLTGIDAERSLACLAFESLAPGIAPRPDVWNELALSGIPWLLESLRRDGQVVVRSADEVPMDAVGEVAIQRAVGFQAAVSVALRRADGTVFGWVSVMHHAPRIWSQADIELVGLVARILSAVEFRLGEESALRENGLALDRANHLLRERQAQLVHLQKMDAVTRLAASVAGEIDRPVQDIGDGLRFLQTALGELWSYEENMLYMAQMGGVDAQARGAMIAEAREQAGIDQLQADLVAGIEQGLTAVTRIGDLLETLSRFVATGGQRFAPGDVNQAIRQAVVIAEPFCRDWADVVVQLDDQAPLLRCDLPAIKQVVLELIRNAAQAIADGMGAVDKRGRIQITSVVAGGDLEVRISDDGAGIDEAIRERMFEPFVTTKPVGQGCGQGLAMVHHVVAQLHQGRIEVLSETGRGSTIVVGLPYEPPEDLRSELSVTTTRRRNRGSITFGG